MVPILAFNAQNPTFLGVKCPARYPGWRLNASLSFFTGRFERPAFSVQFLCCMFWIFNSLYYWLEKTQFWKYFWIFNDEREKHQKDSMHENFGSKHIMLATTLWMSRWTPRTLWRSWWTSRTYFWKIFDAKKTCKTPNLEIFHA